MDKGLNFGVLTVKGQSVRSKLIITFIIIALGPLCLLTWFSFQHVNNTLKQNAHSELNELSNIGKQFAEIWFLDQVNDLYLLKSQLSISPTKEHALINDFVRQYDFINHIEIIDVLSNKAKIELSLFNQIQESELTKLFIAQNKTDKALFHSMVVEGHAHHIVSLPIFDDQNKLKSVLLADVNLQGLLNNLSKIQAKNTSVAFFILHNSKIEKQTRASVATPPLLNQNSSAPKQVFSYANNNEKYFMHTLMNLIF